MSPLVNQESIRTFLSTQENTQRQNEQANDQQLKLMEMNNKLENDRVERELMPKRLELEDKKLQLENKIKAWNANIDAGKLINDWLTGDSTRGYYDAQTQKIKNESELDMQIKIVETVLKIRQDERDTVTARNNTDLIPMDKTMQVVKANTDVVTKLTPEFEAANKSANASLDEVTFGLVEADSKNPEKKNAKYDFLADLADVNEFGDQPAAEQARTFAKIVINRVVGRSPNGQLPSDPTARREALAGEARGFVNESLIKVAEKWYAHKKNGVTADSESGKSIENMHIVSDRIEEVISKLSGNNAMQTQAVMGTIKTMAVNPHLSGNLETFIRRLGGVDDEGNLLLPAETADTIIGLANSYRSAATEVIGRFEQGGGRYTLGISNTPIVTNSKHPRTIEIIEINKKKIEDMGAAAALAEKIWPTNQISDSQITNIYHNMSSAASLQAQIDAANSSSASALRKLDISSDPETPFANWDAGWSVDENGNASWDFNTYMENTYDVNNPLRKFLKWGTAKMDNSGFGGGSGSSSTRRVTAGSSRN